MTHCYHDMPRSTPGTGPLPRQPLETPFPRLVLALSVAQERGDRYPLEQRAVDAGGRPPQRPDHVQPQDHPRLTGVVPRRVLVPVVEEHRLAFGPVPRLAVHLDPAGIRRVGDLQGEVAADHTAEGAAVW